MRKSKTELRRIGEKRRWASDMIRFNRYEWAHYYDRNSLLFVRPQALAAAHHARSAYVRSHGKNCSDLFLERRRCRPLMPAWACGCPEYRNQTAVGNRKQRQ